MLPRSSPRLSRRTPSTSARIDTTDTSGVSATTSALPVTLSRFMKADYCRAIGGCQASALVQVLVRADSCVAGSEGFERRVARSQARLPPGRTPNPDGCAPELNQGYSSDFECGGRRRHGSHGVMLERLGHSTSICHPFLSKRATKDLHLNLGTVWEQLLRGSRSEITTPSCSCAIWRLDARGGIIPPW